MIMPYLRFLSTKKARYKHWPKWVRNLIWQSPNSGVRLATRARIGKSSGTSLALFRSFKDSRWHFHFGPAWKA